MMPTVLLVAQNLNATDLLLMGVFVLGIDDCYKMILSQVSIRKSLLIDEFNASRQQGAGPNAYSSD